VVADPADCWLGSHATDERGPLPQPTAPMSQRFAHQPVLCVT